MPINNDFAISISKPFRDTLFPSPPPCFLSLYTLPVSKRSEHERTFLEVFLLKGMIGYKYWYELCIILFQ